MKTFVSVLTGVWLRMPQIVATISILVMIGRALPQERRDALEKDWPRLANLIRAVRAIFPDVVKAFRAIVGIWTGKPWRVPLDFKKIEGITATLIVDETDGPVSRESTQIPFPPPLVTPEPARDNDTQLPLVLPTRNDAPEK